MATFGGSGPGLDQLEHLGLDLLVDAGGAHSLEQGREVVHELPRRDLGEKVGSAILDAGIGEVQGAELGVGVLVADAAFEGAHGLLGGDSLGPDDIGDLEVQGDVLQAAAGGLFDLLVQGRVGRGRPPAHHGGRL